MQLLTGASLSPPKSVQASRPRNLSILTDVVGYSPWKLGDHPVLASLAGLIPALLARRNPSSQLRPARIKPRRESAHAVAAFLPFVMDGRMRLRRRALKHRQFPVTASLVEAKNIEIAVVALDLEVVIISSRPRIDGFDDFDDAPVQPNPPRP